MAKPWWGPFVIQSSLAFVARFAFRLTLAGGARRRNLKLRAATLEPACPQASSSVTTLASSFRPRGRNDSDRKARPTTGLPCARALASGCARQRCEAMHHCPAPSEFPWLGASSGLFARRVCPVRQQLPQGLHVSFATLCIIAPLRLIFRGWGHLPACSLGGCAPCDSNCLRLCMSAVRLYASLSRSV